jgi:hypothetical protein
MKRLLICLFVTVACSSSESSTPMHPGGAQTATGASTTTTATTSATTTSATTSSAATGGTGGGAIADAAADGSGGGGAPPSSDAASEREAACRAFASTLCAKIASCTQFVLGALYGDVATCEKRIALTCIPSFDAPGTSATPGKTTACGRAIGALACGPFLTGDFGADCKTSPGTIATGGACAEDAQCATTFCARAPDAACGVCAATTKPGDACVRNSCSAGTVCPAGQSMCIAPVAGQVNDACTAQEQCDLAHAVGCNTTSKKCLGLTLAPQGGSCGANSIVPTSYAVCPAGGTCSAAIAGKCTPAADDGASCSTADTGTHCLPPARCVGGRCTVPDPTACR